MGALKKLAARWRSEFRARHTGTTLRLDRGTPHTLTLLEFPRSVFLIFFFLSRPSPLVLEPDLDGASASARHRPPLPTPLKNDESIDRDAFVRLINFQLEAGVHGLWILGTTARFDMIPDARQRIIAETAVETAAGRVPMVLNVSDQGTERTLERARMFDDLAYDYYAALPPWYQPMTGPEVVDYFRALADRLARPLVIYNAPRVCNQLNFAQLRSLAEHPRIVGAKDVCPGLTRMIDWTAAERREQGFSYLHGTDQVAFSTELSSDGFVTSLSNPLPELAVAIWDAVRGDDAVRAFRLQVAVLPARPGDDVRSHARLSRSDVPPARIARADAPGSAAVGQRSHGAPRDRSDGAGRDPSRGRSHPGRLIPISCRASRVCRRIGGDDKPPIC